MDVFNILKYGAQAGASDIHIVAGSPPLFRINGQLLPLADAPELTHEQAATLIGRLMTDRQRQRFEKEYVVDFSLALDGIRYRANVLFQYNGIEAILRIIPDRIPSAEELGLPPAVIQLAHLPRGLVLLTGTTGSGKTTTIASLIDLINQTRRGNIVTIEDPIEFIHKNKLCVVSQREVGLHTTDFQSALRFVLRQDPDVVLIGEMRDYETIAAAISIAETGHLVFATLHTMDAAQAVDRIIDAFPGHQQTQIRTQISSVLKAVVTQALVPRLDGKGRIAAREIMIVTPAIANLIRQGKTHEIYSAIDTGGTLGMIGMDRSLNDLVKRGIIDTREAAHRYHQPDTGSMFPPVIS